MKGPEYGGIPLWSELTTNTQLTPPPYSLALSTPGYPNSIVRKNSRIFETKQRN
jgi:hypothetical protein